MEGPGKQAVEQSGYLPIARGAAQLLGLLSWERAGALARGSPGFYMMWPLLALTLGAFDLFTTHVYFQVHFSTFLPLPVNLPQFLLLFLSNELLMSSNGHLMF